MLLVSAPGLFYIRFVHLVFCGIDGWYFWFELVCASLYCDVLYVAVHNCHTDHNKLLKVLRRTLVNYRQDVIIMS